MAFLLIWARSAEVQMETIYNFYCEQASKKVAKKIVSSIIFDAQKLAGNPFIGQREILLENRPNEYRYIISHTYKIIYFVEPERNIINIVDVFDCRQNPQKIFRIQ